jgi:chromatin segregation and condensation protein Rec8/ScpA/Scc1 (kleisin family)
MESEDFSMELALQLDKIRNDIISGKISLLELELSSIFQKINETLNVKNLLNYSKPFESTCELLEDKFNELKKLLNTINSDKLFNDYLKKKSPNDNEIYSLLSKTWRNPFVIESISLEFLKYSNSRFSKEKKEIKSIDHIFKEVYGGNFYIQIPEKKFTEKMDIYLNKIYPLLPCKFQDLFDNENDQIKIYEKFVYILHLLQLGILKFNKESSLVYR